MTIRLEQTQRRVIKDCTCPLGQKERMLRHFLPVKRVLSGSGNPTFRESCRLLITSLGEMSPDFNTLAEVALMDLKALETKWRTALSSILDELTEDEFRKLLFNLEKIPQGKKEVRMRGDMPSVIIQYYGTEISITLMVRQMKNLPRLDAAVQQPLRGMKDELKKLREKSKGQLSGGRVGREPDLLLKTFYITR
ncbi:hypothetical protein NQZ68_033094 [Dissostichus eleginoides]|nr:hypothetical protein NQZ68_033094 [Dissostichus eleginoides]